jgi:hypothetical protein
MAIAEQVSFSLVRFEWTPPDRLEVVGAWVGVDRDDLSKVMLSLYGPRSTHRLQAIGGNLANMRNWSAVFAWTGDPDTVERAELVVGETLVVDLPVSNSKQPRRRFGRTSLPVRDVEPQTPEPSAPAADADVLALHAAMVAAQDEAAEARDVLARVEAEGERAREQAKRERTLRESDVARLHESMDTLRRLAEDSLQKEREATRRVSVQLHELEASTSGLREEAGQLIEQVQRAVAERDEATARLEAAGEEVARVRAQLDGVDVDLAAGRRAQEEAEELRSELARARQELERASADAERLRGKLAALREVFEQGA